VSKLGEHVKDGLTPLDRIALPKVMNVVRILVRVLPFVLEDTVTNWQTGLFEKVALFFLPLSFLTFSTSIRLNSQLLLSSFLLCALRFPQVIEESPNRTFAEKLVDLVLNSLFLPGLTLPQTVLKRKDGTYAIIWETGVGATSAPSSTQEVDMHRTELLKLLLVLTSQILYGASSSFRTQGVYFIDMIMKRISKTSVMALLGSLINVVMQYDPVGVGVPYNYFMFSDTREALATVSLHVLLVLLDYRYPFDPSDPKTPVHVQHSEQSSEQLDNLASKASLLCVFCLQQKRRKKKK